MTEHERDRGGDAGAWRRRSTRWRPRSTAGCEADREPGGARPPSFMRSAPTARGSPPISTPRPRASRGLETTNREIARRLDAAIETHPLGARRASEP